MATDRVIENLVYRYAELVDAGDFAGVGTLLSHATFVAGDEQAVGAEAIEALARRTTVVPEDGRPQTKHLMTNVRVEVEEYAGTAEARSYFSVLQALPGFPLQVVASGTYEDKFERGDGSWWFVERKTVLDLVGDTTNLLPRVDTSAQ
ncbi:nuclear transport factor 2 family protein [Kribbella sp. NBC_01245]|uniref:nuclear transport factor 2 family protein n=1 Tax=Kribbella sp. NBC_01245 TaxID=2903578 RepID=UPI002E2B4E66|nr:nuclear transport factor 2 family protein [Kribbella sp. NBC_01245]